MSHQRYSNSFLLCFGLLIAIGLGCNSEPSSREGITIAAAASMQFAAEALRQDFTQRTGIPVSLITGSSGKLTAQIREGAPYDLFLSADQNYPNALSEQHLTLGSPEVFASGSLVFWMVKADSSTSFQELSKASVRHLAIANPETAPYGRAAWELLQKIDSSGSLQDRLVYGESIAQVNQFISSGAAEVGFTALSVVTAPQLKDVGRYEVIPDSLYAKIWQVAAVIRSKDEEKMAVATAFQQYLHSAAARDILRKFGYRVPVE
ncbi:molybdate ABC transporter substrate-binding protein [Neolewinella agarilytica]|uniref:molybdate ABC transporter substrate-binding protein n=1 Tax=Neolewinella agarilytica TaxID=478744 RepID=UPI00235606A8|nr:molybdate ABC transporter substrate-binding protein [Neolewinella agarilytica]